MRNLSLIFIFSIFTAMLLTQGTAMATKSPIITRGVISAIKLNIHKAPSRHAAIVGIVKKGDKVKIYKQIGGIGGWLKVYCKGIIGYIRNRPKYVKLIKNNAKNHLKTTKYIPENKKQNIKNQYLKNKETKIHNKIITEVKKLNDFTEKESKIIDGLNDLDRVLNKMRKIVASLSDEIKKLNYQIMETTEKRRKLLSEIDRDKACAESSLINFYKMKMMGITELFPMPDSVFDFIIQQNYLKRIVNYDMNTIDIEIKEMNTLRVLSKQLSEKKKKKHLLDERLKDHIRIMKKESDRRKAILKDIRDKKELGYAAIAALRQAAQKLDNKIAAIEEHPLMEKTGKSFADYRGKLEMPVKGKIVSRFGPEKNSNYSAFTFQSGIDIKTDRGEPVRSVFRGRVIFAQWLKGYGNVIIIDHGNNYYTLYAHVDEIFKKKGSVINTGEVIATAGDTDSLKGTCLHFEVRFHGKPVNPMKWLKKGA